MEESSKKLEQLKEEYNRIYENLVQDEESVPHLDEQKYKDVSTSYIIDTLKEIDLKEILETVNQTEEQFSAVVTQYHTIQKELQEAEQLLNEHQGTEDITILNQDIEHIEKLQKNLNQIASAIDQFTEALDNKKTQIQETLYQY